MTEKRLYEVVNPSDVITFRATVVEAACIGDRLRPAWYFVKDVQTGDEPKIDNLEEEYEAIWKSADKLASYAEAYRSFMVGSRSERELLEEAVSRMTQDEAKAYRAQWHDKRRTSMNDICRQVWETAEKIASYEAEAA
ncbi:hypothetical protein G9X67_14995 [Rhizobium sp. WYCCWR 11152]|uniref:hypothetical protein n=1 Tax=Rhizobium sp. WYCCWR 11152 TaxID=2692316 RepID=UPI001492AAE9|nr:hypothetical protein [Rhizobium sp. WYCCWR 11152]NNU66578.1 hypothetical protein [Rhizobium sp. WYCCWR 11152]